MAYLEDYEKRLLFSALYREKKICEKVDKECTGKIKLKPIVESLENKFYYDRFEKEIRNKAIDEFAERLRLNTSEYEIMDGFGVIEEIVDAVDIDKIWEMAEQMKGE